MVHHSLRVDSENWFSKIKNNSVVQIVAAVLAIVVEIALIIAGFGFLSSLFIILMIGIIIFFGSLNQLTASLIITAISKMTLGSLRQLFGIWFTDPRVGQTFDFIDATSWVTLMLAIFVTIFTITTLTGSVKLIQFRVNNEQKTT